jgi:hypothetical protein
MKSCARPDSLRETNAPSQRFPETGFLARQLDQGLASLGARIGSRLLERPVYSYIVTSVNRPTASCGKPDQLPIFKAARSRLAPANTKIVRRRRRSPAEDRTPKIYQPLDARVLSISPVKDYDLPAYEWVAHSPGSKEKMETALTSLQIQASQARDPVVADRLKKRYQKIKIIDDFYLEDQPPKKND